MGFCMYDCMGVWDNCFCIDMEYGRMYTDSMGVCVYQECETLRVEAEEAIRQSRISERENKRLKTLTGDLGRQVQVLLKECEEARGGMVSSSHDQSHDISSHDISSSSQVISAHLVTFK